jgi:hypothetical protein
MKFRFRCFAIRHVRSRWTVIPLELPHLAIHGPSLERASEDLALAIDDRITRAHPRHVATGLAVSAQLAVAAAVLRAAH